MPALTLDFQNSKQLDPRVTFSRSSSATYINSAGQVAYAAEHEPRFDHDGNGECLGLLIEESRTNLRTHSAITTAEFTSYQNRATIVASTETAPDGTVSGLQITNNTGTSQYCWGEFTDYTTVPTTGFICASIFVKMVSGTEIEVKGDISNQGWMGFAGVRVDFSTANPTVTLLGASGQNALGGDAIPYGNGWWRIWYYIDTADGFNTGQTKAVGVVPRIAGTSAYIWGAQIEAGKFPTSYIPTSGSELTRSADVAEMTGTNFSSWFNGNQGTMVSDVIVPFKECSYYAFSGANRITALSYTTPGTLTQSIGSQLGFAGTSYDDPVKFAVAYDDLEFVAVRDGGTVQSDPSTVNKTGIDKLYLGRFWSGTNFAKGVTIARLSYYNERLTDAELQTITL